MQSSATIYDFSGQTLRNRSFQAQDLAGADFSYTTIQGCDFSNARLVQANFVGARIVRHRWQVQLAVLGPVLLAILVAMAAIAILVATFAGPLPRPIAAILVGAIAIVSAVIVKAFAEASAGFFTLTIAIVGFLASAFSTIAILLQKDILNALVGAVLLLLFAGFIYFRLATLNTLLNAIDSRKSNRFRNANLTRANFQEAEIDNADFSGAILAWVDWKDSRISPRCQFSIDRTIIDLCCQRQTLAPQTLAPNYSGVNLSQLNLSQAKLMEVDLSAANLQGTNLSYANLSRANLRSANLRDTDFSQANLTAANLSAANALGTTFAGATLTDACIFGWGINASTNFVKIRCDRIYVGLNNTLRKPSRGTFAPGEFLRLLAQFQPTLDLILETPIHSAAFDFAFQTLLEQYAQTNITLQAVEQIGDSKIQVQLGLQADLSLYPTLYADFFHTYETHKAECLEQLQHKQQSIAQQKQELSDLESIPQQSQFLDRLIEYEIHPPIAFDAKTILTDPSGWPDNLDPECNPNPENNPDAENRFAPESNPELERNSESEGNAESEGDAESEGNAESEGDLASEQNVELAPTPEPEYPLGMEPNPQLESTLDPEQTLDPDRDRNIGPNLTPPTTRWLKFPFHVGIDPHAFDFAYQQLLNKYGNDTLIIHAVERLNHRTRIVSLALTDPQLDSETVQQEFLQHYRYNQERFVSRTQALRANIRQAEQEIAILQNQPSKVLQRLFNTAQPSPNHFGVG